MAAEESTRDGGGNASRITFAEGDLVVYPNHGAGCVAGVEENVPFACR